MQGYISKHQHSKVESAPSSPRQRFLEVRQRRSRPASKGSVADSELQQLTVKQFLSTQPHADKVKAPSAGDHQATKATALLKNQQLCLFEVCKLQNVLNSYICQLLPAKTERVTANGEHHEVDHPKIIKLIDQFLSIFPGAKEHSERVMIFQSNMTNKSNQTDAQTIQLTQEQLTENRYVSLPVSTIALNITDTQSARSNQILSFRQMKQFDQTGMKSARNSQLAQRGQPVKPHGITFKTSNHGSGQKQQHQANPGVLNICGLNLEKAQRQQEPLDDDHQTSTMLDHLPSRPQNMEGVEQIISTENTVMHVRN